MNFDHSIPNKEDLDGFQIQAAQQLITHVHLAMVYATAGRPGEYYHFVTGLDVSPDIHKALSAGGSLVDNMFSPEAGVAVSVYIDYNLPYHSIFPRLK